MAYFLDYLNNVNKWIRENKPDRPEIIKEIMQKTTKTQHNTMIQPNELRIGNWVRIKESDTVIKVEPYMLSISELINHSPIPLTPEVLEKCGFNDFNEIWIEDMYGNDVVLQYDFGDKDLQVGGNWYKCQYLHQLQNLYFALTGQELEYKP